MPASAGNTPEIPSDSAGKEINSESAILLKAETTTFRLDLIEREVKEGLECKLSESVGAFWEEKDGRERRLCREDELIVAIEVYDDCMADVCENVERLFCCC